MLQAQAVSDARGHDASLQPTIERFEIFKGEMDDGGVIRRVKSVGQSRLSEGYRTYIMQLKMLLNDPFYLLPEKDNAGGFAILTREDSLSASRKYFWNKVGSAQTLPSPNQWTIKLTLDLFNFDDIYMSLVPLSRSGQTTSTLHTKAAS